MYTAKNGGNGDIFFLEPGLAKTIASNLHKISRKQSHRDKSIELLPGVVDSKAAFTEARSIRFKADLQVLDSKQIDFLDKNVKDADSEYIKLRTSYQQSHGITLEIQLLNAKIKRSTRAAMKIISYFLSWFSLVLIPDFAYCGSLAKKQKKKSRIPITVKSVMQRQCHSQVLKHLIALSSRRGNAVVIVSEAYSTMFGDCLCMNLHSPGIFVVNNRC